MNKSVVSNWFLVFGLLLPNQQSILLLKTNNQQLKTS